MIKLLLTSANSLINHNASKQIFNQQNLNSSLNYFIDNFYFNIILNLLRIMTDEKYDDMTEKMIDEKTNKNSDQSTNLKF